MSSCVFDTSDPILIDSYNSPLQVYFRVVSHIHVSAAYRLRIYENFDTPRSEAYFVHATYVPRTCDVPVTFPWRISDVSVKKYTP